MEDNKYYIPQIEEFHVGFEYELEDPITKLWVKFIFEEDKLWFVKSNKVRVKYLDKSDIESLGFKIFKEDIYRYKDTNYYLSYDFNVHSLFVWRELNLKTNPSYPLVNALIINNINELQVILKQIGVTNE
jgi:hypothetical protein